MKILGDWQAIGPRIFKISNIFFVSELQDEGIGYTKRSMQDLIGNVDIKSSMGTSIIVYFTLCPSFQSAS